MDTFAVCAGIVMTINLSILDFKLWNNSKQMGYSNL